MERLSGLTGRDAAGHPLVDLGREPRDGLAREWHGLGEVATAHAVVDGRCGQAARGAHFRQPHEALCQHARLAVYGCSGGSRVGRLDVRTDHLRSSSMGWNRAELLGGARYCSEPCQSRQARGLGQRGNVVHYGWTTSRRLTDRQMRHKRLPKPVARRQKAAGALRAARVARHVRCARRAPAVRYRAAATTFARGSSGEAEDVRAPTARRWDPASPARFIEWFLCTCMTCSERHAPWRCAALAAAENYADLCTWLMQMCPRMAPRALHARDSLLGR